MAPKKKSYSAKSARAGKDIGKHARGWPHTTVKKRKPPWNGSAGRDEEAPAKRRATGASLFEGSSVEGDDPPLREPYYDFVAHSVT